MLACWLACWLAWVLAWLLACVLPSVLASLLALLLAWVLAWVLAWLLAWQRRLVAKLTRQKVTIQGSLGAKQHKTINRTECRTSAAGESVAL